MRLDRLEIVGFGGLRDRALDFGPGLTVILGDNESGKSTVHRAVRAALYGLDAGGQGRSIERSDWLRWQPWDGGTYGLALTYTMNGGLVFRVARRLDQREQRVQVMEIGGGDVTDDVRVHRAVVPGLIHLGIDEAVFCASACLLEDGLRVDSADAATKRVPELQQAIERLADSGSGVTAAQAAQRLRDAAQRIGSARRPTSPLGAATLRARQLESEIDVVRRRTDALAAEQDRGRELETAAAHADRLRIESECAWIVGRLATLRAKRQQLESAAADMARLDDQVATHQEHAGFPLDEEEQVIALSAELGPAQASAREGAERAELGRHRLAETGRRRSEIAAGARALAATPSVGDETLAAVEVLATQLTAEAGSDRRRDALGAAETRCSALRKEIAATGLGSVPPGAGPQVRALAATASGSTRRDLRPWAALAAALAVVLTVVALVSGHRPLAVVAGGLPLIAAAAVLAAARFGGGPAAEAMRELRRLAPGLDTGDAGLERIRRRLPTLESLHVELHRQVVLADAARADMMEVRARIAALVDQCTALAHEAGVARAATPAGRGQDPGRGAAGTTEELLARGRAELSAITEAASRVARRRELTDEDARLVLDERALEQVLQEAARRNERLADVEARLARLLARAGIGPGDDTAAAIARYREGCSARRQYEVAVRDRADLRRRIAGIGTDLPALLTAIEKLESKLVARGGDPAVTATARPLDDGELEELEAAQDRANHAAVTAMTEAAQLRARVAGLLDGLPAVADLEDELAIRTQARDRANRQLAALEKARVVLEASTHGVHRAVAPRLARSIGQRLALLTDARYEAVNIDTDRFAVSLQSHERPDLVPLEFTSHGTRDQVSLLLRLALAEVFGDAGEPVPLLLDEPLLTADPRRRRRAVEFIAALAEETQVIITSSDPQFAATLCAENEAAAVITLVEPPLPLPGRAHARRRMATAE